LIGIPVNIDLFGLGLGLGDETLSCDVNCSIFLTCDDLGRMHSSIDLW
jgi:hypothetical protein